MRSASSVLPLALLVSQLASAAEPLEGEPFTAEPSALLAVANAGARPKTPVEVLLDETSYVFDAQGGRTLKWRRIYRVLDAKAALRGYQSAWAVWAPWYQERPELRARVIGPDGHVTELDAKTISESPLIQSSDDTFSDSRILVAPLPSLVDGAVVEVLQVRRDSNSPFRSGIGQRLELQEASPVRKVRIAFKVPKSLTLHQRLSGFDAPVRTHEEGANRIITIDAGPFSEFDAQETNVPRGEPPLATLWFTLGTSWKDAAREYSEIAEKQLSQEDISAEARRVVGDAKSAEDAVNRILRWMKAIRYTGIEFGDAAYVPRSPRETLTRGFGDCKDLATLMVAMLRATGHPASVALLRVMGTDVANDMPTLMMFDHAIVRVEGAKPLWVDPTQPEFGAGAIPWSNQGRKALVASTRTTELELIPLLPASQNLERVVVDIKLADSGPGNVRETREGTGWFAQVLRAVRRTNEKERREARERAFKEAYDVETITALEEPDCLPADTCSISVAGTASKKVQTADIDAIAVLNPYTPFADVPQELRTDDDQPGAKVRKQPLSFTPGVVDVRYHVVPPIGFRVRALPSPLKQTLGPALYTGTAAALPDGSVDVVFRIDTVKSVYSAAEVAAFRKAANALQLADWSRVTFDSEVMLAAKDGKMKVALERARVFAAQQPRAGAPQVRLARVLLEAGFGDLAREAARRGTELAPEDSAAWRGLGFTLEHDLLGRRFHSPFDYDGAIAAYKKADAIKPTTATVSALAWVLEHNSRGERWGAGARLEEAVKQYQRLAELQKSHEADPYILAALLYLHRYDDVLARAPGIPQTPFRNQVWITALAVNQGVPAALARAEQLTSSEDLRRALLLQAVPHLLRLQAYPEAALLFRASQGPQSDAQSRATLAILPSLKKRDAWGIPSGDPRLVIANLFALSINPEASPKEYSALFAHTALEGSKASDLKSGGLVLARAATPLRNLALPPEVLLDFCMASATWTVTGDARTGWRLRGTALGTGSHFDLYLLKEDNSPRILGVSPMLSPLGLLALQLVRTGQGAEARKWLTWARESVSELPNAGGDLWLSYLEFSHPADLESDTGLVTAATVLALHGPGEVSLGPILAIRQRATDRVAASLDWALAAHLGQRGQWQQSLDAAERFASFDRNSVAAFALRSTALLKLGKTKELETLAKARLAELPGDELAPRALVSAAHANGDVQGSRKLAEARKASGRATAADYNQLAWDGLVLGLADADSYEAAQRAFEMTNGKSAAVLNTYAALSAATGKPGEAQKLLLETLTARGDGPLQASDWLVVGLMAEQYGLLDAARAAFEKTISTESDETPAVASSTIAKARLAKFATTGQR